MKKQEYYKIVRRVGRKLYSWQYFSLPKNLRTQYYLHRPTISKVGGLLVFDSLQEAQEYCRIQPPYELYRCTCRDEVALPHYRDSFFSLSKLRVNCWNRKKWTQLDNSFLWPNSTKAFKVVTLRERMW